ncbi:MAG: hypothetical protein QNL88_04805 [Acidobacteriota bacterium]|nr:hypothetical protein [Acidobacteriota bacterium]
MTWLEQNIDAYRIVSEILGDLRRAIRGGLEAVFGDAWYRDGLPTEVFDRLVAAKEREKSIDWYEGQYQQIMDYAVFADLVEILEHNTDHFSELIALAPSEALLQARFVELDVMRAKLGRARPISETELSFLGTFHLRFRKAISEMPVREPVESEDLPAEEPVEEQKPPMRRASDRPPKQAPVQPPPDVPPEPDDPEPAPLPPIPETVKQVVEGVVQPVEADNGGDDDPEEGGDEAPPKPPKRAVQSSTTPNPVEIEEEPSDEPKEAEAALESDDDGEDGAENTRAAVGPKKLAVALENNEHRTILRELYREVTTIAEGVWSSEVTPAPLVWEQVTASEWYKDNFSRLGLQALSAFYEVTGNVEEMARQGATKKQLQEFLKETNFAKTLLALRDMFQASNL